MRHVSDRVAVMYLDRIVEQGDDADIYERPTHPHTQALLSAVAVPDPAQRGSRRRILLEGEVPSPVDPPSGCTFRTRCWRAQDRCATEIPVLEARSGSPHPSACHYAEMLSPSA